MIHCHLFVFIIMGCAIGKESTTGKKIDLLPQLEAGTLKNDAKVDDFTVIKADPLSKAPKYRTKIDSRVTSKYDIKALIGKGSFSDVLRVESKTSRVPYAIKVIRVRTIQEQEVINAELDALRRLEHPYIINLHEVIKSKECSYLILELATGGELYDKIKSRGHLDERFSCNITQMLLSGMSYLHSEGVVHRDLKPENLLFYHPGSDSKILITDFGFAKVLHEDNPLTTWCGTPEYIAPELLEKKPYNKKVDIWAIGVIVFVMLSGHLPFSADTTPKLFKQIIDGSFSYTREVWNTVSESARDFIIKLLQVDPELRLDATQASSHEWMSAYPVLHKQKNKLNNQRSRQKLAQKRSELRLENDSIPLRNMKRASVEYADSVDSESWLNTINKKQNIGTKQKLEGKESNNTHIIQNGLVLPFTGNFSGNILTKDKILDDNASSISPSNVDSMLATEDTNSVTSNLFQQFYAKYVDTEDPTIRNEMKEHYLQNLTQNNIKLPIQFGLPLNDEFMVPKESLKQRRDSVRKQFENIDEDSEDEILLTMNSNTMNLSRLDRIYGNNASMTSAPSFKSETMPVEGNNLRYIEKVGVWLTDQELDSLKENNANYLQNNKYTSDIDPDNLFDRRTVSGKSNMTTSDNSQTSSFNRFLLPTQSRKQRKPKDIIQIKPYGPSSSQHSGISNGNLRTGNLLTGSEIHDTLSFNSTSTVYKPLLISNGHASTSYA